MLATCAYNLQRVNDMIDDCSLVLLESEACELSSCLRVHLKSFWWLAAYFSEQRKLLFKLRCKSHYLFHSADDVERFQLNLSMFHCWAEESYLGKVKAIMNNCHGGSATKAFFNRYLLGLAINLEELRKTESQLE